MSAYDLRRKVKELHAKLGASRPSALRKNECERMIGIYEEILKRQEEVPLKKETHHLPPREPRRPCNKRRRHRLLRFHAGTVRGYISTICANDATGKNGFTHPTGSSAGMITCHGKPARPVIIIDISLRRDLGH